jgi:hypothetical protein
MTEKELCITRKAAMAEKEHFYIAVFLAMIKKVYFHMNICFLLLQACETTKKIFSVIARSASEAWYHEAIQKYFLKNKSLFN